MDLRQFLSGVDWSAVKRIRTARSGKFYSFSVEVNHQRNIISIGIGPGTTTLTVSDTAGRILKHVVQQGQELVFYEPKAGAEPKVGDALGRLAPVRIVSTKPDSDFSERGI